jgi:hypothetical protein
MQIAYFIVAAALLLLTSSILYRMVRKRPKAKTATKEIKEAEDVTNNVNDAILRAAFPEYDPKNVIQSGDPLLWATTPDGRHWRIGIDHIYGIKDVAIFPRVFFEPPDCRGRRFYANKASGKVVVNPQEMEGLRLATTDEIKRDIPNIRYSTDYVHNIVFDTLWLNHINEHLKLLQETRSNLADTHKLSDKTVPGYRYAPALKAYVPGDVAEVLNKDSFLSGLEWPDIYEYHA